MTVQELINELLKVEDKTKKVKSYCGCRYVMLPKVVNLIQEEDAEGGDVVVIY